MGQISSVKTDSNERSEKRPAEHNGSNVMDRVQGMATDVMDKAKEGATEAKDRVKEAFENVPEIIGRYPLQSVLIGFGLGVLAAMLLNGRK